MKSRLKILKYLVLSISIFIVGHLHPEISQICHEKIYPVITSVKKGFYPAYKRECAACPAIGADFRMSWFINHEEESEGSKELFKVTHCQARAPPYS